MMDTDSKILHTIAAKHLIELKESEEEEESKEEIIQLSTNYAIASKYASFVAIEERDSSFVGTVEMVEMEPDEIELHRSVASSVPESGVPIPSWNLAEMKKKSTTTTTAAPAPAPVPRPAPGPSAEASASAARAAAAARSWPVSSSGLLPSFAKLITGQTHLIEFSPSNTLAEYKLRIQDKCGIPASQMRLMFAGKLLEDEERTMADYSVERESTIIVILRLRGMM